MPLPPPPRVVAAPGLPPPVVAAPGMGCPQEEGAFYFVRKAAPWIAGALMLGAVALAAAKPSGFTAWRRGLSARSRKNVRRWLRENAPPPGWRGSRLEWAYNSMPLWKV